MGNDQWAGRRTGAWAVLAIGQRSPLTIAKLPIELVIDHCQLSIETIACSCRRLVVIPREESELVARFGDQYRQYRRGTGSLLPPLGPGARRSPGSRTLSAFHGFIGGHGR